MQIDEKTWCIDSVMAWKAFCSWAWTQWQEHKYITFVMRIGRDRSIDQNSLLHVWLTEYCAHLAGITKKQVTKGMVEFLKRKAKRDYYTQTGYEWMLDRLVDPETGVEGNAFYASSADYKRGEMFLFLCWLQDTAANDGLVLESRGEYAKLQRLQEAA